MRSRFPRTILEAATGLRCGAFSSGDLVCDAMTRARALDPILGVYLTKFGDAALKAADIADRELAMGHDRGPLHGVPIGIKDNIATYESPISAQSRILDKGWQPGKDAAVVKRIRSAGGIIMGKTTMMEFACGYPEARDPTSAPRNPWDLNRWAGGSSSGNANGVAAQLFLGAVGTDTGGSIRGPASYCGITGLKPTFGLVPTAGCLPCSISFDTVGPMARSAWDCAAMLSAMALPLVTDSASPAPSASRYTDPLGDSLHGVRIGVCSPIWFGHGDLDPGVTLAFNSAVTELTSAGASCSSVEIPCYKDLEDVHALTWPAEIFSYQRDWLQARWNDYGTHTRTLIALGGLISAGDLTRADRVREFGRTRIHKLFDQVDVLVMPTTTSGAPPIDEIFSGTGSPALTQVWNTVGLPALTVPMGYGADATPIGLQVVAPSSHDDLALKVGHAYQQRTSFHLDIPSLLNPAPSN